MNQNKHYYGYQMYLFWRDFPEVNVDAAFVQNRKNYIFSGKILICSDNIQYHFIPSVQLSIYLFYLLNE